MLMTLIQFLLLDHGLSCYASESKVACEGDGSVAMKSYHEGLTDDEYVSNAMADAATRLTACCVLWSCFCPASVQEGSTLDLSGSDTPAHYPVQDS